jgi:hypothetical protein
MTVPAYGAAASAHHPSPTGAASSSGASASSAGGSAGGASTGAAGAQATAKVVNNTNITANSKLFFDIFFTPFVVLHYSAQ